MGPCETGDCGKGGKWQVWSTLWRQNNKVDDGFGIRVRKGNCQNDPCIPDIIVPFTELGSLRAAV